MGNRVPHYRAIFFGRDDSAEWFGRQAQFRKRLFVDHFGWDLPYSDECEIDQFDRQSTIYCALLFDDRMVGMFRANRTDGPYLAADVFPQLAKLVHFPRHSECWEISRFGVVTAGAALHAPVNYGLMFYFASSSQAQALVAIADLTYERYLRSLGIRSRRYGPPQVIGQNRYGKDILVVAGEIPIRDQRGQRFQRLIAAIQDVEISDVGHVLRPDRISA